jgi:hypothetical protein
MTLLASPASFLPADLAEFYKPVDANRQHRNSGDQ